ncbi:MAG: methyltransferase [Deltaproteobacteria bacterium]|nr:methyltransferase [Deltaproteobacteria bacterium]
MTTRDALLGGRIPYRQPARGYRVALEAPMVARFAIDGRRRPFEHAVDLGSGPGAIALMLTATGWAARATAVEVDATHAELAAENARGQPIEVVHADVRHLPPIAPADLVIANPPWFETDQGAVAPEPSRAAARAFVHGALQSFLTAARKLLGPRGRLVITLPASRTTELFDALERSGLHPKRARFVHPRPQREAQVVFVEAKPGKPGGLEIGPPWCVRPEHGESYVPETEDALWGRWPRASSGTAEAEPP